jgi:excisionase family DNA binding protein
MSADKGSSVLTIVELSDYLKISKSTPYKLAQEGSILARRWVNIGGSTRTPSTSGFVRRGSQYFDHRRNCDTET